MGWHVKTPVTLGGNVGVGIPPALALAIFIIGGGLFFALSFFVNLTTGGLVAFAISGGAWVLVMSFQRRDRFCTGVLVEWIRAKEQMFLKSIQHRGDFGWPL